MDQETARELFHNGATLLFLDVPEGTEFGIDYKSWQVGPLFKGVKMIPPGIHFVYYSASNHENDTAPRTGFFHNFKQQEVLVKKWDPQMEGLHVEEVSAVEQERLEASKMDLDRFLGPYPYDTYKKWVSLSNHLSASLLQRIQPLSGHISAVTMFQSRGSNTRERLEALAQAQEAESPGQLPRMDTVPGTEIRFTEIPRKKYPEGATPAEITKCNMDHSYILLSLLETTYEENTAILGELQFAFICFLIGQNLESFEQWKKLVHLMCRCDEAMSTHSGLFSQFISVLHYHLQDIPEDFFVDIVSQDNFLTATLQEFFSNLEGSKASQQLKSKGLRFCEHLQKKFKWDFTSEPYDCAPVVVE